MEADDGVVGSPDTLELMVDKLYFSPIPLSALLRARDTSASVFSRNDEMLCIPLGELLPRSDARFPDVLMGESSCVVSTFRSSVAKPSPAYL